MTFELSNVLLKADIIISTQILLFTGELDGLLRRHFDEVTI